MKVIIAGSRTLSSYAHVEKAIQESGFDITEVVSGGARGIDQTGIDWARAQADHWEKPRVIPVKIMLPDWDNKGKKAGILRNVDMAVYADALIAIWDGKSKGTKHMIEAAHRKGLHVHVFQPVAKKQSKSQESKKSGVQNKNRRRNLSPKVRNDRNGDME